MKIGEKRSLTSSMKKAIEKFVSEHQSNAFTSESEMLTQVFESWMNQSKQANYSWVTAQNEASKQYIALPEFQPEMVERLKGLMPKDVFVYSPKVEEAKPSQEKVMVAVKKPVLVEVKPSKELIQMEVAQAEKQVKLPPLRSKKKRLRKKREKQLLMLAQQ